MNGFTLSTFLATLLVLPPCLAAQTIQMLDGDRRTQAIVSANSPTTGNRIESIRTGSSTDLQCFTSDLEAVLRYPPPYQPSEMGVAAATQHSCVFAESIVADGSIDNWSLPGYGGAAGGQSTLRMRFVVDVPVHYQVRGRVRSSADAGGGAAFVRAFTSFRLTSEADSTVVESLCLSTQPESPGVCADSTDVAEEGDLEPGTYTLWAGSDLNA